MILQLPSLRDVASFAQTASFPANLIYGPASETSLWRELYLCHFDDPRKTGWALHGPDAFDIQPIAWRKEAQRTVHALEDWTKGKLVTMVSNVIPRLKLFSARVVEGADFARLRLRKCSRNAQLQALRASLVCSSPPALRPCPLSTFSYSLLVHCQSNLSHSRGRSMSRRTDCSSRSPFISTRLASTSPRTLSPLHARSPTAIACLVVRSTL